MIDDPTVQPPSTVLAAIFKSLQPVERPVTFAFDSDRAGHQAALRAMELFGFYSSFTSPPSKWPEAPPPVFTRSSWNPKVETADCRVIMEPPWWLPPYPVDRLGRCFECSYRSFLALPLSQLCVHCLANCPPYGPYLRCEHEAYFAWVLRNSILGRMDPFPGYWTAEAASPGRPGGGVNRGQGYGLLYAFRQVNLAEYVSRFTTLQPVKAGRWKGKCPIHEEKTASFHVSANPWRWHCFGACSTGGDLVKLIAELRRIGRIHA